MFPTSILSFESSAADRPQPAHGLRSPATGPESVPLSARLLTSPRWLAAHALFSLGFAIFWLLDEPIFRAANRFYNGGVEINGELHQLILSLKQYGQLLGILAALVLVFLFDCRRRGRVFLLASVVVCAGIGSGLVKTVVGRQRPLESNGRTELLGPAHGVSASRNQSFPSGHTATAFALSYGLARLYPQGRVFFWALAGGVAFNRGLTVMHFATDILAGAWLGLVTAAGILASRSFRDAADRLDRLLAPAAERASRANGSVRALTRVRPLLASPAFLFLVSLALHWTGNSQTGLWDRDEPRFATATREMMARGDWIVPTFNGELRADKPILIYWLMGAAYRVFGDGPFAARAVSGLAGSLACLVLVRLGTRMFDRRTGLLAGWLLALSPMLIVESKLATVDALLLLLLLSSLAALWEIVSHPASWVAPLLFWTSLGLAVLAKGPVALGVIAATLLVYGVVARDFSWLWRLRTGFGLCLLGAIVLPWCLAVQWATDGEFLHRALGHHVIKRSLVPLENHSGFPGYYLVTLLGVMAPWAWLLPWSVQRHWSDLFRDRRLIFLFGWGVGTLLLFELVRTKLVHYYLPAYPALALFLASALVGTTNPRWILPARHLDPRLGPILSLIGPALAASALGLALFRFPTEAVLPTAIVVICLGGGLFLAGQLLRRHRLRLAFLSIATGMVLGLLGASQLLLPTLGQHRSVVRVANRLAELRADNAIALWHYCDPSIIYNLGTEVPQIDRLRNRPIYPEAHDLARRHGHFLCPMLADHLDKIRLDPNLRVTVEETLEQWDLNGLKPRTVHIVSVRTRGDGGELPLETAANSPAPPEH